MAKISATSFVRLCDLVAPLVLICAQVGEKQIYPWWHHAPLTSRTPDITLPWHHAPLTSRSPDITHPWPSSKRKFHIKSDRVSPVAPASPIECLLYLPNIRAIQYKLGPKRLTRIGNSNVQRLSVTLLVV